MCPDAGGVGTSSCVWIRASEPTDKHVLRSGSKIQQGSRNDVYSLIHSYSGS